MSEAIAHRGPDDCGLYAPGDTGIALGHRRLSIIDTSTAGHQPMVSPSGRWIVVFNGEIYNAEDLRARCDSSTAFRGHSDTEVLCGLIDRVGPRAAAEQAIGMFAFAAWDTVERTLVLVRDRLGIKPLYLASTSGTIGFSSELSALRGVSDLVGPVSRSGLAGLLRLGYIPSPSTILDGVEKIEPGTIVEARVEGDRVVCSRQTWWSASQCHSNASDPGLGDIEAVDQLESLIETAVRDRLVSDRPLGAFLSGGIDSSTVVAFMSKLSSSPINTFTIGFEDAEYDEAQHARRVAEHFGTRHTELYIREQDALDIVPELGSMFDEPFADSSQIPMALISRLARRDVVVCLSGDGGDELFAGYDRYAWTMRLWNRMRFVPGVLRRAGGFGLGALPRPVSESLGRLANRCVPNSIRVRNPADKVQRLAEALRQPDSMSVYQDMVGHWKDPTRLLIDADPLAAHDILP